MFEIAREFSAGAALYRKTELGSEILLILDRFGRWTLPKGHVEAGETAEEAALRELGEETGLEGRIVRRLARVGYSFREGGRPVRKTVEFFLVEHLGGALRPDPAEVADLRWVVLEEAERLVGYENNRTILRLVREALEEASRRP